jgi:cytochrome c oxidase subunit 2
LVGFRQRVVRPLDRTNRTARSLSASLFLALAAVVAACASQPQLPPQPGNEQPPGFFPTDPITQQGQATQDLYLITFIISVIVFVIVEGLLLFISFRFRRRATDTGLPTQTHGSNPLEILWTVIPAITVTALFIAALMTLNQEAEASAADTPDVVIDVTGFQWQWTFEYPDAGVALTGTGRNGPTMGLPINERVRIRLHATDVIHSFYVPQFLYKKDAVPGRVNEFDVVVEQAGTFGGQCAEFCGLSHTDMLFTVQAMPRADFDAWLVDQQQAQPSLPPPPSGAPTVQVTSVGVVEGFDPTTLTVAADSPWVVHLTNADPAVPHDFAIRGANPDGSDWQGDPDAQGGGSATYQPPPLPAGSYEFYCSIHPNMTGTLTAGP